MLVIEPWLFRFMVVLHVKEQMVETIDNRIQTQEFKQTPNLLEWLLECVWQKSTSWMISRQVRYEDAAWGMSLHSLNKTYWEDSEQEPQKDNTTSGGAVCKVFCNSILPIHWNNPVREIMFMTGDTEVREMQLHTLLTR